MNQSMDPGLHTRPPDPSLGSTMDSIIFAPTNNDKSVDEECEISLPCAQPTRFTTYSPYKCQENEISELFPLPGLQQLENNKDLRDYNMNDENNNQEFNIVQILPTPSGSTTVNSTIQSMGKKSVILIRAKKEEDSKELIRNPIKINQEIKRAPFNTVNISDIRINRKSGIIAIESTTTLIQQQVINLTSVEEFCNIPVTCYLPNSDSHVSGVINPIDLETDLDMLARELKTDDSSEIVKIERLKKRVDNNWENSLSIKITFLNNKCPTYVSVQYIKYKVRPYIASPMQCFNCQRLGHTTKSCRAPRPRCLLCGGAHSKDQCDSGNERLCINCKENHAANSRRCKYIKEAIEIEKVKAYNQVNYNEARQIVARQQTEPTSNGSQVNNIDARRNNYSPTSMHNGYGLSYSDICKTPTQTRNYNMTRNNNTLTTKEIGTQTENNSMNSNNNVAFFNNLRNLLVELLQINTMQAVQSKKQNIIETTMEKHFENYTRNENCAQTKQPELPEAHKKRKHSTRNQRTATEDKDDEISTTYTDEEDHRIWETVEKTVVRKNVNDNSEKQTVNSGKRPKRKKNRQ